MTPRQVAREWNRCLSRFQTGEAVGAVQCKRSHGHRGMHKAVAPWGSVDWAEKTAPVLSATIRAGLIAFHQGEHVYTKTLAALARRWLVTYAPANGGYVQCPAGAALIASWHRCLWTAKREATVADLVPPKKRNWTKGTSQVGVFVRTAAGSTIEMCSDHASEDEAIFARALIAGVHRLSPTTIRKVASDVAKLSKQDNGRPASLHQVGDKRGGE